MPLQTISSDEINLLIWKYLQESGFTHSTFSFQHESHVAKADIKDLTVEPGALINVLQKGLQLQELEAHIGPDGAVRSCSAPFSLVHPHVCDQQDGMPKKAIVKKEEQTSNGKRKRRQPTDDDDKQDRVDQDMDVDVVVNGNDDVNTPNSPPVDTPTANGKDTNASANTNTNANGSSKSSHEAIRWKGHDGSVFIGCWNPAFPGMLATGAGDATAKIWDVPKEGSKPDSPVVLKHLPVMLDKKDITALDWHPDGNVLATGSYDGQARLWDSQGGLIHVLSKHEGPVFSLKWNQMGTLLLSASLDGSAITWDVEKGKPKHQWLLHKSGCLDVDWRDERTFASCSSDKSIKVVNVDEEQEVKTFTGHKDEVNAVQWDPSGEMIASCSDDKTVRIWTMESGNPIQTFSHEKAIYTCRWCPAGSSTSSNRIVASASWDHTVRLWNVDEGTCLHVLQQHTEPVYTIAFSPDGRHLASGSFDNTLIVWDASKGTPTMQYNAEEGVFDLGWTRTGDRLVACLANGWVAVFNWDV